MRLTRLLEVFCIAFCAAALALPARAEPAGKVLTAGGDALVLRGSQILRISSGSAIESGDQIHTGADGKALIVFTDSGLIWIRSNSDFVVDEYSYANGQGGRESAFFSLLKGGARSVTGLIGRRNRMSYRLRVSVATIGIRGTDFSVVMCQRDCRESDGGLAAKGLYGEVLEGRIAVTPLDDRVLEREFAAGDKADEQARFIDQTGIVIAPGSPGAASGPALSNLLGPATTGGLTGSLIGGPINGLTGTLSNLTGTLTKGLTGTVTGGSPGRLLGLGSGAAPSVGSTVSGVISPVVNTVGGITTPVTNTVGGTIAPVVNTVGVVTAPVVSTVTPVVAPVVSTVTPVVAPVVSTVTPVVAPVVSTVAPVVTPITAPAPLVTIPGTISTTLPSALPTSPLLRH